MISFILGVVVGMILPKPNKKIRSYNDGLSDIYYIPENKKDKDKFDPDKYSILTEL